MRRAAGEEMRSVAAIMPPSAAELPPWGVFLTVGVFLVAVVIVLTRRR